MCKKIVINLSFAMLCVEFPISAVHGFKWVNSCFESCRHCDWWTLKLIDYFCGQSCSLWLLSLNGGWIRVSGPRKSVPSIEVTNTKIMSTFFRDQILCPLNGGVPKERFHCLHRMYNSVRAAMSLTGRKSLQLLTCFGAKRQYQKWVVKNTKQVNLNCAFWARWLASSEFNRQVLLFSR